MNNAPGITLFCEGEEVTFATMNEVYGLSYNKLLLMCQKEQFIYDGFTFKATNDFAKKPKRKKGRGRKTIYNLEGAIKRTEPIEGKHIRCFVGDSEKSYTIQKTCSKLGLANKRFYEICKKYKFFQVSGILIDTILSRDNTDYIYDVMSDKGIVKENILIKEVVKFLGVKKQVIGDNYRARENGYKSLIKNEFWIVRRHK